MNSPFIGFSSAAPRDVGDFDFNLAESDNESSVDLFFLEHEECAADPPELTNSGLFTGEP